MAYNCWAAPILWETTLWSPDLPNPQVKQWVELNISPGVPLKAGKTYRITIHTIPTWEWWDEDHWVSDDTIAAVMAWALQDNPYTRGHYAYGCHYGGSGSWIPTTNDLTFRVYDSEGVTSDKQETAYNYIGFFRYTYAGSQTFTPEEDYTVVKIALMLCQRETIARGYLKVKLQRVTMGEPGFVWVEGTKLAYTDSEGFKLTKEGTTTGQTGTAGYLWVEGTYLHYIDENGDERREEGTAEGATGKVAGHIWVELTKLRYIDSSGNERYIEGT